MGARTFGTVVRKGATLIVVFLPMLPVTYYLPEFLGDDLLGGGTELVALVIWIAIAALLAVALRTGIRWTIATRRTADR